MRLVLDLNVVLDVLLSRHDHLESAEILSLARSSAIEAYVPAHGVTTIYYILRKEFGDKDARKALEQLFLSVKIVDANSILFDRALRSGIVDFEDAVVAESAAMIHADHIITRNKRHFHSSEVPCLSAPEFMANYARI
jgi:predicted nucleic acid-binding protein